METAQRFLGLALGWTAICLFWLGVNVFDGWMQRNVYPRVRARCALLREQVRGRHAAGAAKKLRRPGGIGE